MGRAEQSIDVQAPVEVCYGIWTQFEQFPRFMKNVEEVHYKGDTRQMHWRVKGPMGSHVSWDAEIDTLESNKVVSWHSVRDADVSQAGAVRFEPLDAQQTRVKVVIEYHPPAGMAGQVIANLFSNPQKMLEEDLNHFKQLAETVAQNPQLQMAGSTAQACSGPSNTASSMRGDADTASRQQTTVVGIGPSI
jgi:uncharacterized membrane protein